MARKHKHLACNTIETLESRTLLSAAVALTVAEAPYYGGTQLQINGTSGNDQIGVKQTTAGLVISNSGGWSKTVTDPINSIWINGGAGNNSIVVDPSVTLDCILIGGGSSDTLQAGSGNDTLYGGTGKNHLTAGAGSDTLVSLGSIADTLVGGSGVDSFWTDNSSAEKIVNLSATEANGGYVHRVGGFINAAPAAKKAAAGKVHAASGPLAEPATDAGYAYANFSSDPIFSSAGPSENDIYQGYSGDCYFLSVLSSVAKTDPARIRNSILNLGDGTVIVQYVKNGHDVYVHEDQMLPMGSGSLAYANLGAQNSTWVALMEKAWCYVRTNIVSYDAIGSGWMDETYQALGANPTTTNTIAGPTALMNLIQRDLAAGQSVTYGTDSAPSTSTLVGAHAYTVDSVNVDAKGVATLTLRNPWGVNVDGGGNGYVTISAADAYKSFTGLVAANV